MLLLGHCYFIMGGGGPEDGDKDKISLQNVVFLDLYFNRTLGKVLLECQIIIPTTTTTSTMTTTIITTLPSTV